MASRPRRRERSSRDCGTGRVGSPAVIVGGRALGPAIEHGLNASVVADIEDVVTVVERSLAHPVRALLAPDLAARIPRGGPSSSVGVEAIHTTSALFSQAALVGADAVRVAARHGQAMELLAYRDELTGLWNRRACDDRLLALTDDDRSHAAVLMLDVDRFKSINDAHGHEAEDAALVRVAHAIETAIRPTDLAARFGGDEFMVLLGSTTPEMTMAVAERIRTAVAHTHAGEPRVSVSIGVTKAAETSRATRLAADRALYEAKETGRDRIVMAG
jgi:diguanylate cyclase (GGDEF)-like protein